MIFGINPFEITISKEKISLFVFGVTYNSGNAKINRAIGFSLLKWRMPDRSEWRLTLTFYSFIKRIVVKTELDVIISDAIIAVA